MHVYLSSFNIKTWPPCRFVGVSSLMTWTTLISGLLKLFPVSNQQKEWEPPGYGWMRGMLVYNNFLSSIAKNYHQSFIGTNLHVQRLGQLLQCCVLVKASVKPCLSQFSLPVRLIILLAFYLVNFDDIWNSTSWCKLCVFFCVCLLETQNLCRWFVDEEEVSPAQRYHAISEVPMIGSL